MRERRYILIIETIVKWAIPFILGAAVSGAATYIRMQKQHDKALSTGVQCLLRAQIIAYHERYTSAGSCPVYAKESLRRMYGAYHALGGNDVATSLYEATLELPTHDTNSEQEDV